MLERFSISLDGKLMADFDRWLRRHKYNNRSEALRDLIRKAMVKELWAENKEVVGVITIVYDHHQRQLQDRLTEIQHEFHHDVVSTTHIHLNHDECLEVIIARGRATRIQLLADHLIAVRGVKDGSLSVSAAGEYLH